MDLMLSLLIFFTFKSVKLDDADICTIDNCRHCTTPDECSVCQLGWFGKQCNYTCKGNKTKCSICSDSYLRKRFNDFETYCLECASNEFFSNSVCHSCPKNCIKCNGLNDCTECRAGFFGMTCDTECPSNCVICESADSCITCKGDWQGDICQCGPNCLKEGKSSEWCSVNGTCLKGCIKGKRGSTCNLDCRDQGKCLECDQYIQRCHECLNGWYGSNYCNETCGHCSPDEKGDIVCNIEDGKCSYGCVDGYYCESCNDKIQDCELDKQDVVVNCSNEECNISCSNGYFGKNCENKCSLNCNDSIEDTNRCEKESGQCIHGCIPGFYGRTCDMKCSESCHNKTCHQRTGQCINGCILGWFGLNCTLACSNSCLNQSCNSTGYCDLGCESSWYGDNCQKMCNENCVNKSCSRLSGLCDRGCIDSINGMNCSISCVGRCKDNACDRQTSLCMLGCDVGYEGTYCNETMQADFGALAIITNGGIAGALIVLSFFFVVCSLIRYAVCLRRGKIFNNCTKGNVESVYDEIPENSFAMAKLTNCANEEDHFYSSVDFVLDSDDCFSDCKFDGDCYGKLIDKKDRNNEYTDLITMMNSRTSVQQFLLRGTSKASTKINKYHSQSSGNINPLFLETSPQYDCMAIDPQLDISNDNKPECSYLGTDSTRTRLTSGSETYIETQQDWGKGRPQLKTFSYDENDQSDYIHPVC